MASLRDQYDQKLNNLNYQIETHRSNISELTEKNKLLELTNNSYNLEKEKLINTINESKNKHLINDSEIDKLNKKNQELLEQINFLRSIESQNHNLSVENEKINQDIAKLNSILRDKNLEIDILNKKVRYLDEILNDFKIRKQEEIQEIEQKIKYNAELDKKMELLQIQSKYNDLQAEYTRNLGIFNQKSAEINILKEGIEKLKE